MAASHGRAGRPWRRLREQVLRRDPYCTIRGPKCTGLSTTVDHVIPLSQRPDLGHDPANLRGACAACNYAGGARLTNGRRGGGAPARRWEVTALRWLQSDDHPGSAPGARSLGDRAPSHRPSPSPHP